MEVNKQGPSCRPLNPCCKVRTARRADYLASRSRLDQHQLCCWLPHPTLTMLASAPFPSLWCQAHTQSSTNACNATFATPGKPAHASPAGRTPSEIPGRLGAQACAASAWLPEPQALAQGVAASWGPLRCQMTSLSWLAVLHIIFMFVFEGYSVLLCVRVSLTA